jgi:AcrR family transcriptional regulator
MLDAAERLIRERGPDVTMDDLAAASSVTKPILYRMVGDRSDVVAALSERFVRRANDAGGRAIDTSAPLRTQIHQLIGSYLRIVDGERHLYAFVAAGGAVDDRISRGLELADLSALPLARVLRRAGVEPSASATWAYAFVGALQLLTFRWLRDDEPSLDDLTEQLTDLLWSGMAGARATSA